MHPSIRPYTRQFKNFHLNIFGHQDFSKKNFTINVPENPVQYQECDKKKATDFVSRVLMFEM